MLGLIGALSALGHDGLVDNPIGASTVTYLDSSSSQKWTATQSGGAPDGCDFKQNTDLKPASGTDSGTEKGASDQATCCELCWAEATCAAAVFTGSQCWLKSKTDMAGGAYARDGRTTCVRKYGAPAALTIPASVPGDLLTDLQRAGQIGDPLYEKNWLNSTIWHAYNWTYSTQFSVSERALSAAGSARLVFDGVKMGAAVSVNGVPLGVADDQFLRYDFDLSAKEHLLRAGEGANTLEVTFDPAIEVNGRFMACTGGWDWAPYSHTFSQNAHTFSKGIWKSVSLAESRPRTLLARAQI
jgi:hypothetical protein